MMKKIWTLLLAVCMVTVMMPAMAFAEGEGGTTTKTYTVDFGTGSWTVGDVTVTADKSGEQPLTMDTVITLTGFDADTMTAQVAASNGFKIGLKVTEGKTSLSAINGDGVLPDVLTFSVVAKSNENPPVASAGALTFTCQSNAVTGGNIFYKLNGTGDFIHVTASDGQYNPITLADSDTSITSITIKLVANDGYSLDSVRGVTLSVNGLEKFNKTDDQTAAFTSDSGYTINLSELIGSEGSISQSTFKLEFGFGKDNPDPEQPGTDDPNEENKRPAHFGENGYISFDTNGTVGRISYAYSSDASNLENLTWIPVSVDKNSNCYVPVNMSSLGEVSTVFFRIEGNGSKHLDLDRGFTVKNSNHEQLYTVYGTFNDEPDKVGIQPDGKGLKDMYNNMNDWYVIPVSKSILVSDSTTDSIKDARFIECSWTDMMSISVSVDEASQYMIATGKTDIGIASGRGFGVSIQNGSNVSIPVLEDTNEDGRQERYLIDLKVNRNYFIPEISINGQSYETIDTGEGGDNFTNISVAVPAKDFKALIAEAKGVLTIHLTVDKNVPVAQQGDSEDVQASFNMINNGTIPENTPVEKLDASVGLTAQEATLSDEEKGNGAVEAYEITMDVDSTPSTNFVVPIDISIAGNFDGDVNGYSVIREHEGEIPQAIPCTIERGENSSTLSFSTDKFSKFTIMYSSSSGGSSGGGGGSSGGGGSAGGTGGGGTAPSETEDSNITNSGSETGGVASTTLDLNISAKHEEGRTTAAVDPALGDRLVENAVKNNSTSIVLDLTGLGNDGSSSSEISFSPATFYGIASKTSASVTFQTDSAEVMFDRKSVAAVSSQAGTDGYLSFIAETTENSKKKVEVNLKIETSNGPITNFNGGNVTVTVPVNDALASKNLTCVYIDDKGKFTKMGGALLAGKKLFSFNTTHFSTYAILEEAEADAIIAKQNIKVGTAGVKLYTAKGGKLRVKASAKNATGYKVYYKKSSWKNYKTYTKGKVETLDKTFKKLSKGKYTVKVKAYYKDYNGTGDVTWGKLSSAKKITVRR